MPSSENDERLEFVADGFKNNFNVVDENPEGLNTNKYFEFESYLTIENSDTYTFYNGSDDASEIYIDGQLINDNGGCHSYQEVETSLYLEEGIYPIKVKWYGIYGGDRLSCQYSSSLFDRKDIPDELLRVPTTINASNECTSFVFYAKDNPIILDDIVCKINKNTNTIETPILPNGYDIYNLVPTFVSEAKSVCVNGKEQISGLTSQKFDKDITYSFYDEAGEKRDYIVKFNVRNTGLPAICINTDGKTEITSKETYLNANIAITGGNTSYSKPLNKIKTNIRGRGNHSWGLDKKSYRLKFDSKISLLGFNSAKSYILQSNHVDPSLIRNYVSYNFAKKLGKTLGYTTDTAFFDLYLNGKYMGNYMLMEKLVLNKNQLDLQDKSTTKDIGCLLEVDFRNDQEGTLDVDYFKTDSGKMFAFKEPDELTAAQKAYIKSYVQNVETKIMNNQDVSDIMDMDSFVDWFLVMTVVKNNDADMWASCYFHKDKGGKLKWGPVWDFDTCLGDCYWVASSDSWYPSGSGNWIDKLVKTDEFKIKFKARWNELRNTYINQIFDCIDYVSELNRKSFEENMKVWKVFDDFFWLTPNELKSIKTYDGQIQYMKTWLTNRLRWIDENIEAFTAINTNAKSAMRLNVVSSKESAALKPTFEKSICINGNSIQCGEFKLSLSGPNIDINSIVLDNIANVNDRNTVFDYNVKDNILHVAFVSNAPFYANVELFKINYAADLENDLTLSESRFYDASYTKIDALCEFVKKEEIKE